MAKVIAGMKLLVVSACMVLLCFMGFSAGPNEITVSAAASLKNALRTWERLLNFRTRG